ncbi:hypothetical protein CN918_30470 [Priestia megaterium]|nr:hypothetical protein CN918_30470 [Priestia megaterium]
MREGGFITKIIIKKDFLSISLFPKINKDKFNIKISIRNNGVAPIHLNKDNRGNISCDLLTSEKHLSLLRHIPFKKDIYTKPSLFRGIYKKKTNTDPFLTLNPGSCLSNKLKLRTNAILLENTPLILVIHTSEKTISVPLILNTNHLQFPSFKSISKLDENSNLTLSINAYQDKSCFFGEISILNTSKQEYVLSGYKHELNSIGLRVFQSNDRLLKIEPQQTVISKSVKAKYATSTAFSIPPGETLTYFVISHDLLSAMPLSFQLTLKYKTERDQNFKTVTTEAIEWQ